MEEEEILLKDPKVQSMIWEDQQDPGSFGSGIQEDSHLNMRYDPSISVFRLDLHVVLSRPGFITFHHCVQEAQDKACRGQAQWTKGQQPAGSRMSASFFQKASEGLERQLSHYRPVYTSKCQEFGSQEANKMSSPRCTKPSNKT